MKTVGYCDHGPSDGVGPFAELFNKKVRLREAKSLEGLDAIILWGGEDISPSLYDEKPHYTSGPPQPTARDIFEWEMIRQAKEKGIPVIGVCRGAQMMCAFVGGKLIQHVAGHVGGSGGHDVETYDNKTFNSTSCHHQMMYPYLVDHELLAWCDKPRSTLYEPNNTEHSEAYKIGSIKEPEVVYFPQVNGFAVQGHPEWQARSSFTYWCLEQIEKKCLTKCEC